MGKSSFRIAGDNGVLICLFLHFPLYFLLGYKSFFTCDFCKIENFSKGVETFHTMIEA
jgi:hypothetical protein